MNVTGNHPAAKLAMMKLSIRCLVLGILALVPIIGVGFALAAGWASGGARRYERELWNPARPHRIIGLICAVCGALIWSGVDILLIFRAVECYIG